MNVSRGGEEGRGRGGPGSEGGNAGRLVLVYLVQVRGFNPVVGRLDVLVSRGKKKHKNIVDCCEHKSEGSHSHRTDSSQN